MFPSKVPRIKIYRTNIDSGGTIFLLLACAAMLFYGGCVGENKWEEYDESMRIAHAVVLCDAWVMSHNTRYKIRQIWRSAPDVLKEHSIGDELRLPGLWTGQFYRRWEKGCFLSMQKKVVILFISDSLKTYSVFGRKTPDIKPDLRWGIESWGGEGEMIGEFRVDEIIRYMDASRNRRKIGTMLYIWHRQLEKEAKEGRVDSGPLSRENNHNDVDIGKALNEMTSP